MEKAKGSGASKPKRNVVVMVLGDIGRSPRMQYHSLSLANVEEADAHVDFIGFKGTKPRESIDKHPNITQHGIYTLPNIFPRLLYPLYALLKLMLLFAQLLYILLWQIKSIDAILVQNPPAIPTLMIAHFVSRVRSCKFIIDWHNFGYSILAINLGEKSLLVKIYKWYELYYGKKADANFCVSRAMREELAENWGVRASVLHDRAPSFFKRLRINEAHELFVELEEKFCNVATSMEVKLSEFETLFTVRRDKGKEKKEELKHDAIFQKENRPALIISSTSWTPDEDFSVLFDAITLLEERVTKTGKPFPKLIFVITGKGPDKKKYKKLLKEKNLQYSVVLTMWLSAENYPKLLGACDLGISLHKSSSGFDLPMKVVDMFGCGLPVLAYKFHCIDELVQHKQNGLHFDERKQLANQIYKLFKRFPDKTKLRQITGKTHTNWDENWTENAWRKVLAHVLKL